MLFRSVSQSRYPTPTQTPTITSSVTPTITPTVTSTPTQTPTQTSSETPTSTVTPTLTVTPTMTVTPTIIATSPTPTQTSTLTPTITNTPTSTPGYASSGLVLYFNPGNTSSYPGTGNRVFDLSGNSNTGTMSNVTFSDSYFSFNGSTSQIQINDNPTSSETPTIS